MTYFPLMQRVALVVDLINWRQIERACLYGDDPGNSARERKRENNAQCF
jgi:hypothetical protein